MNLFLWSSWYNFRDIELKFCDLLGGWKLAVKQNFSTIPKQGLQA